MYYSQMAEQYFQAYDYKDNPACYLSSASEYSAEYAPDFYSGSRKCKCNHTDNAYRNPDIYV